MFASYRSVLGQLRHSPGFAATVILILTIGIGLTSAIYSVLDSVVLQPLPLFQPDRLVAVVAKPWSFFSVPTIKDWQSRGRSFQSIVALGGWAPSIESSAGSGHAKAILVSQNFVATLGVKLELGRDFSQSLQEADCAAEAIVSDDYWHRNGGGPLSGIKLRLDHIPYAVVGVLSGQIEGLNELDEPAIITPIGCDPSKPTERRGNSSFYAIGRLRSGVSLRDANADIQTTQKGISNDFRHDYPEGLKPVLVPLADYETGNGSHAALFATLAGCCVLLLISCSNLSNLVLARYTRRRSEFAIRTALGAAKRDFVWQALLENGALTVAGAALGILLALVLVRLAANITVIHLPRLADAKLNLPALVFAAIVTVTVALLLTLLPTAGSASNNPLADLTSGVSRSSSASGRLRNAGRLLVASQLAFALILVASAGWMVSSVLMLLYQPLGFEPGHLLIASTDLGGPRPQAPIQPAKALSILQQAMNRVRILPGVAGVAAANDKPLGGRVNRYNFCVDQHPEACQQPGLDSPDVFLVTPEYFHTVGQQVLRGREFTAADNGRDHVAVVNRALAAHHWPGQSPVGHRIFSGDLNAWATVVGEVADVHSYSLERAPVPNLYLPEADGPDTSMTIFVRTTDDPGLLSGPLRRTLKQDSNLAVRYVESMPELMGHQVAVRSFLMWVASAFGLLALGISILGTYGLVAYDLSLREREIGIRLALGSSRRAIVELLLFQESRWILGGMGVGLIGAVTVGFLLRSQFFQTEAASLPVLGASLLFLGLPALIAVAIPGSRASLLDPAVALRKE